MFDDDDDVLANVGRLVQLSEVALQPLPVVREAVDVHQGATVGRESWKAFSGRAHDLQTKGHGFESHHELGFFTNLLLESS